MQKCAGESEKGRDEDAQHKGRPYKEEVRINMINESLVKLELDTGSAVTIISAQLWKQMDEPTPRKPAAVLKSYTGQRLKLRKEMEVKIKITGKIRKVWCE